MVKIANRYKKVMQDGNGNVEFIILEDVTKHHHFSNVLDIKLGSAQYAKQNNREEKLDQKTREKMERAIVKCRESTSSEFCFRINGAQVYREDKVCCKLFISLLKRIIL